MKPFTLYSGRFKLNFEPNKNRFPEKFTLVLPFNGFVLKRISLRIFFKTGSFIFWPMLF